MHCEILSGARYIAIHSTARSLHMSWKRHMCMALHLYRLQAGATYHITAKPCFNQFSIKYNQ